VPRVRSALRRLTLALAVGCADQFATVANQMADDTASIDTWWVGQDPTRDLRFHQAVFSASCTGLDISFLKLSEPKKPKKKS
jgi:hypothetical protein